MNSLDLGSNPLGAATPAMEKLKDALAVNKTVKELSLSSVGLSSEACVTLAEALPLSSLSRLDLTFNPIDVAGMMAIAASLKENSTVSEIEVVPVLKQNRDGGGRLVDVSKACLRDTRTITESRDSSQEDPQFTKLLDDIAAQCEKTAIKLREAEEARLKEIEASGRTQEEIEQEEEEEEEREMIAQAQQEEKDRLRRQEEREKAEAERALQGDPEPPLTPRKFDATTIHQDFDTAKESFALLKELMDAGGGDPELLEQLYLQCLELEGRLLGAVNNNLVSSEKLLSEYFGWLSIAFRS